MRPYVIVIAGGSGSGKSTLAQRFCEELSPCTVKLLAMDSYYKPEDELPLVTVENGRQYRDYNAPDSFDLARLKADIQTALDKQDCKVLMIEGLLTLWDDEIDELCDLRVFVDCPADVRVIRRIKRNLTWGLSFEDITDVYLDLVRYRHEQYVAPSVEKADIVIASEHGIEDGVQQLMQTTRGLLL